MAFSTAENSGIAESYVASHERHIVGTSELQQDFVNNYCNPYVALEGEKIFWLDIEDVLNPLYGYYIDDGNDKIKNYTLEYGGEATSWWLRSDCIYPFNEKSAYINDNGETSPDDKDKNHGNSPALNLKLSSIVFSRLIRENENSPKAGEYGAEYKLTVVDSDMAIEQTGDTTKTSDNTISVPFKITNNSYVSNPEKISVVVTKGTWTDENGWRTQTGDDLKTGADILQYIEASYTSSTNGNETTGTATFSLNSSITGKWGKDYHVYILVEDINGAYETDYATAPVEITGVSGSDVKLGDVDGDGEITPKDVTILRRHLAGGCNVTIDMEAADVDGDKDVTPKDVTILRRFLAGGWGIKLGE